MVDRLALVGHVISSSDHVEAIFKGLAKEYRHLLSSRSETYIEEPLLVAQEGKIQKHLKYLDILP